MGLWSGVKKTARWGFYPAARVAEDMAAAKRRLGASVEMLKAKREEDARQAEIRVQAAGEGSPRQRFAALAEAGQWTPEELQSQWIAVRRTKWISLVCAGLAFLLSCFLLFIVPVWMLLLIAPATLGMASLGLARVVQFGLYQAQLEQRALISVRDYLSRRDLFSHLVS